ncbi:MAG: dockerin type I repeat-containing protein, partial [Ruminococcus sp.]
TVENAGWLYFCPWYGDHLMSERYQDPVTLSETYNSDYCITLDELPSDWLTAYAEGGEVTTTEPKETTVTTTETTAETTTVSNTTESQETTTTETTTVSESTTTTQTTTGESVTTTETETSTTTETVPVGDVKYGDVNLDDSISVLDVIYLNKYLAKILKLNDQQMANADCCNDTVINSTDASILLRYTIKKIDSLPVSAE